MLVACYLLTPSKGMPIHPAGGARCTHRAYTSIRLREVPIIMSRACNGVDLLSQHKASLEHRELMWLPSEKYPVAPGVEQLHVLLRAMPRTHNSRIFSPLIDPFCHTS